MGKNQNSHGQVVEKTHYNVDLGLDLLLMRWKAQIGDVYDQRTCKYKLYLLQNNINNLKL